MGTLKTEQLPWTQPAFAPLYPAEASPVLTRERWQVMVVFETDEAVVQSLLPEGVEPAWTPPVAAVWCASHAHSTLGGPYREAGWVSQSRSMGRSIFTPLWFTSVSTLKSGLPPAGNCGVIKRNSVTRGFPNQRAAGLSPGRLSGRREVA